MISTIRTALPTATATRLKPSFNGESTEEKKAPKAEQKPPDEHQPLLDQTLPVPTLPEEDVAELKKEMSHAEKALQPVLKSIQAFTGVVRDLISKFLGLLLNAVNQFFNDLADKLEPLDKEAKRDINIEDSPESKTVPKKTAEATDSEQEHDDSGNNDEG